MMNPRSADRVHLEDAPFLLEQLYEEDIQTLISASSLLAGLFTGVQNLEPLLTYETLVPTLVRLLKDEGRRSIELATNILSIFSVLSQFSQFHPLLLEHGLVPVVSHVLCLQVRRRDLWAQDDQYSQVSKARSTSIAEGFPPDKQHNVIAAAQKQDRLLCFAVDTLLHLSESEDLVSQLQQEGLEALTRLLELDDQKLLILVTTSLVRVSASQQGKDTIARCSMAAPLIRQLGSWNQALQVATLSLLYNMSFDTNSRVRMVQQGILAKASELLGSEHSQTLTIKLLYHLSLENTHISMFSYSDSLPVIYSLLLAEDSKQREAHDQIMALAANMTRSSLQNAEVLANHVHFPRLLHMALRPCDAAALTVAQNVSRLCSTTVQSQFAPFMEEMAAALKTEDLEENVFSKLIACLANLSMSGNNRADFVRRHSLLQLLAARFLSHVTDDAVLTEIVTCMRVWCSSDTVDQMTELGMVQRLLQLMKQKSTDSVFMLQAAWTACQLLVHESSRVVLLQDTQVVTVLVDLMQHSSKEVAHAADSALDVVCEASEDWAVRVRALKFEACNQEWLRLIWHDEGEPEDHADHMTSASSSEKGLSLADREDCRPVTALFGGYNRLMDIDLVFD